MGGYFVRVVQYISRQDTAQLSQLTLPIANMLLSLLTALVAAPLALAGPNVWYKMPNTPAEGLESVSAKFNMDPSSPPITGYYAATQFSFIGHDIHYFGVQPFTPGTKNTTGHIAYSVFGKGSKVGDPKQCKGGADGGSGVSCWLDIDLDFGRWYTIESKVVEKTADGSRRWNGTLIDDQGKRTYIASIWTDASYGALSSTVAQWLEWYKYNSDHLTPQTRPCQPPFKMHYTRPVAGNNVAPITRTDNGSKDDKCAWAAGYPNTKAEFLSDGTLQITAGFLNK